MPKIKYGTRKFKEMCLDEILACAPPIIQCVDCGAPALQGYCCSNCGSSNPDNGSDPIDLRELYNCN